MKHPIILVGIVLSTVVVTWLIDSSRAAIAENDSLPSVSGSKGQRREMNSGSRSLDSHFPELNQPEVEEDETVYWPREPFPFKVSKEKDGFGWTSEDGKTAESMKVLANNSVMLAALELENREILRRQLVYVSDAFGVSAQEIYDGRSKNVTIPGFDGELFEVELTHNFPQNTEEISGGFAGKIANIPGSQVVAASDKDHWSIGIALPDRSYQITTRERGEWIIVEHDPNAEPLTQECGCCENGEHEAGKPFVSRYSVDAVGTPFGS